MEGSPEVLTVLVCTVQEGDVEVARGHAFNSAESWVREHVRALANPNLRTIKEEEEAARIIKVPRTKRPGSRSRPPTVRILLKTRVHFLTAH